MLVAHVITTLDEGGAEASLYRLCTSLKDIDAHVICLMGPGKYGPMLHSHGITTTYLNLPRGRINLRGILALWKALRYQSPKVVQTWMYHGNLVGGIVGRLAGIPSIVWSLHNSALVPGENSASTIFISSVCAKLSSIIPQKIICCAEKTADVHASAGYDRSRLIVIPNGYDLDQFQPSSESRREFRRSLGVGDEFLFGMVARFDPAKDHRNLLAALSLLKNEGQNLICLLVGSGMDEHNELLLKWIDEFNVGSMVRLLGRRDDIPDIMNGLDVHLLSSSSEAFPNVLAEAMACGTPCISTAVGDASAIVGETGWLVPAKDPVALSAKIAEVIALIGTPEWDVRQSAARERIAMSFSIEAMSNSYCAIWEDLARQR